MTTNEDRQVEHQRPVQSRQNISNDQINLLETLILLIKNWRILAGAPLLFAVIAALGTLLLPNIYTAKALILPADDDKGMMGAMMAQMGGLAGLAGGSLGGSPKTDLYVTMLESEAIKDPIIDRFKLMKIYDATFRADAYQMLEDRVSVSAGKKDGVITISVDDESPQRAAAIANGYVDELGKQAAGLDMVGASMNRAFLEKQLATANKNLVQAENDLKIFQSKYKAISLPDQAKAAIEGVAQLRAQLAVQEVQLATFQRQFTDSSQEVKSARSAIANIKNQISRLEGVSENTSIPSIGSVPKLGQEYVRLMREFKIQETLVDSLTKLFEMNKLNEAKNIAPFQLIHKANVPELKSKPKRALIVIAVAFVTGFVTLMLVLIQDYCSRMIPEDEERWDRIKTLAPKLAIPITHLNKILSKYKS